jgi:cell shape-determining protein MreC
MAASDTLTQTAVSAVVALLGTGGLGAVITWYVNSRGQKSSSFIQAQKDVYEAFEDLVKSQQSRIDQLVKQIAGSQDDRAKLWEERHREIEHSREQDAALKRCAEESSKQKAELIAHAETIASLNRRLRQLEIARDAKPRAKRNTPDDI